MILCGDKTDVGGGGVGVGGGWPSQNDIGRREERAGRVKNNYVIISYRAKVLGGLLSKVGTPPPHNPVILHGPMTSNTYTHIGNLTIKDNPHPNPKPVLF